jgi:hypothetical protein
MTSRHSEAVDELLRRGLDAKTVPVSRFQCAVSDVVVPDHKQEEVCDGGSDGRCGTRDGD